MLAKTRVKSIDIIAHSMGTWLTMETLRQLAIAGDRDLGGKLGYVVLASPDIDVDVFKKQMMRYGKPDQPSPSCFRRTTGRCKISSSSRATSRASATTAMRPTSPATAWPSSTSASDQGRRPPQPREIRRQSDPGAIARRPSATPAGLASAEPEPAASSTHLGQGLGKAVGSVAEIIITTPFKVLTSDTGGVSAGGDRKAADAFTGQMRCRESDVLFVTGAELCCQCVSTGSAVSRRWKGSWFSCPNIDMP